MAEKEQKLDEKVESEMGKIAGFFNIITNFDDAKVSEQADFVADAKNIMLSDYKEDDPDRDKHSQFLEEEFDTSPYEAYSKISSSLGFTVSNLQDEYEASKDIIYSKIEEKLNSKLKEAKNKLEAVEGLVDYFMPIIGKIETTQEEADIEEINNIRLKTKMVKSTKKHPGIGDIEETRRSKYKQVLASYVVEEKDKEDETKVTYLVDKEKLKEITEKPVQGSVLYTEIQKAA